MTTKRTMTPQEYRQLMTMSDDELLASLRQMAEQAGSMIAAQSLDLIERLRARAEKAEARLHKLGATRDTPSFAGEEASGRSQDGPVEPYTCPYCGGVTTSSREAKARLCVRCVRFEGDAHPAVTGARIAAHNARIMGMLKKKN